MRVAVCIPSYCEADSIAHVLRQVDEGLSRLLDPSSCLIVNVDSASPDGTADAFLATETRCVKESHAVAGPRGKGRNLLRFLELCAERGVEAMATIDADIVTVTPSWPQALLLPLLDRQAGLVAPLYRRSRFKAATTNHLAYPLYYACYGLHVRQPIGGEFGLSRELGEYLLRQPVDDAIFGYGIDTFATMHAAGGGFSVVQVELGEKVDKPTFLKTPGMSAEVAASFLAVTRRYGVAVQTIETGLPPTAIDDSEQYPHQAAARELLIRMRLETRRLEEGYAPFLSDPRLVNEVGADDEERAAAAWSEVLACWIHFGLAARPEEPPSALAELIVPPLLVRQVSWWERALGRDPDELEEEIRSQARLVRGKLVARLGGDRSRTEAHASHSSASQ